MLVAALLFVATGVFMFGYYSPCFTSVAHGQPYLDATILYAPKKLYDLLEQYGQAGRDLYVISALSIDLIVPLIGGLFLTLAALWLAGKCRRSRISPRGIVALGVSVTLFDWLENLLLVAAVKTYPQQSVALAWLAQLATLAKIAVMLAMVAVIVAQIWCWRKNQQEGG